MSAPIIKWSGQSGNLYQYWIHPIGTAFVNKPGNYIFAKETRPGYWVAVYIGQSDDLGRRLGNHDKEDEAKSCGATHVHVHTHVGNETARLAEEKDLILKWKPTCNTQHV